MKGLIRNFFYLLEVELLQTAPDPNPPLSHKPLHIGFNALGALVFPLSRNHCWFVEPYAATQCTQAIHKDGYCQPHQCEAWWQWSDPQNPPQPASAQAKNMAYHSDLAGFTIYSGQELQSLLNIFWQKYAKTQSHKIAWQQNEIQAVARILGFAGTMQLQKANLTEIRNAFRKQCLACHPDMGGSTQKFIELQNAYQEWTFFLISNK